MKPQKCHKRIRPQIINRPAVILGVCLCVCVCLCGCATKCCKCRVINKASSTCLALHPLAIPPLRSAATYSQCANICIFKLVVVVEVVVALLVIALLVVVAVVVVVIVAVVVNCCSALLKQPQNS